MKPSLGRGLFAGLLAGLASGITANLLAAAISSVTAQKFAELNPWAIGLSAVLANLAAGGFFSLLARWTPHPVRHFVVVAVLLAALDSLWTQARMPPGFATIAIPLIVLVAAIAIAMIPRLSMAARAGSA